MTKYCRRVCLSSLVLALSCVLLAFGTAFAWSPRTPLYYMADGFLAGAFLVAATIAGVSSIGWVVTRSISQKQAAA